MELNVTNTEMIMNIIRLSDVVSIYITSNNIKTAFYSAAMSLHISAGAGVYASEGNIEILTSVMICVKICFLCVMLDKRPE